MTLFLLLRWTFRKGQNSMSGGTWKEVFFLQFFVISWSVLRVYSPFSYYSYRSLTSPIPAAPYSAHRPELQICRLKAAWVSVLQWRRLYLLLLLVLLLLLLLQPFYYSYHRRWWLLHSSTTPGRQCCRSHRQTRCALHREDSRKSAYLWTLESSVPLRGASF